MNNDMVNTTEKTHNANNLARVSTRKLTQERRKEMIVKVIPFNISANHLSQIKSLYLNLLYQETKYYTNYLIGLSQIKITDDFGNTIYPNSLIKFDTKNDNITVFNFLTKEHCPYTLTHLSSQMKQKIKENLINDIIGLSERKKKGHKVGQLKFRKQVTLPLKQFNNTYKLDDDCKYLNLQGTSHNFKLHRNKAFTKLSKELGLKELSLNNLTDSKVIELASAQIIRSGSKRNYQYKFLLTIYINPEIYQKDKPLYQITSTQPKRINKNRILKENINEEINVNVSDENINKPKKLKKEQKVLLNKELSQFTMKLTQEQRDLISHTCVGIDAGIGDEFSLNFGETYESITINSRNNPFLIAVLNKIKAVQRELTLFINGKKKKGLAIKTRKYWKLKNHIELLWKKYGDIKANMINHLVSFLSHFKEVHFQDEMIKTWHSNKLKGYGKKVQSGILGKVYAKLKLLNKVSPTKYVLINKSAKTTQNCVVCHRNNRLLLTQRIYRCECGYINNRDGHSGFGMLVHGKADGGSYIKTIEKCYKKCLSSKGSGIEPNLGEMITARQSIGKTISLFFYSLNKLELPSNLEIDYKSFQINTPEASSFTAR